jgi:hypothetical protein
VDGVPAVGPALPDIPSIMNSQDAAMGL